MTLHISSAWLRGDPNVALGPVGANQFRLTTPAEGGGLFVDGERLSPQAWREHAFVTAEAYHESHDVLVLVFAFEDALGRSIAIHYGLLPHVRTTICLPLQALNGDRLFLPRYPGVMQSVLRGDAFVDRETIRAFRISTIPSTTARTVLIANLALSETEPQFDYEAAPYVDELGQLIGRQWDGRIKGPKELRAAWQAEAAELTPAMSDFADWNAYGGWTRLRFDATGYFRTEHDGERWWFVDPDGYALFSAGMDCIHPGGGTRVAGMEHLLPALPEADGEFAEAWQRGEFNFAAANLIALYGSEWWQEWFGRTEQRMKAWGINTIGNWSSPAFIAQSSLPYVWPMYDFPTTAQTIFRDFPDVFDPEYEVHAKRFAEQLHSFQDDRRLIGYFMRNEPHWAFVDSLNLTAHMLRSPLRLRSKTVFLEDVRAKYGDIWQLNAAWRTKFARFEDLLEPELAELTDSPACKRDVDDFNRKLIRRYVEIPAAYCKQTLPHHLNLGMRYAWVSDESILEGCEAFDVFSLNCYAFEPDREHIQWISRKLNKPVMIGEFHFGAADGGLLAYGIRAVATQRERGEAYRYYVESAASLPELIGVHYFQLNDQPVLGRFDGENYQIGAVDVCMMPYPPFAAAMRQTHRDMYGVRTGLIEPFRDCPKEIPKTGF
ncbi:beta-galactosidase [Paenibacillus methanolicus]|uniref:Beta-galactosidase-like protein n=1 Tax=Paenibacillus methanolicus TaxID=582686 RepID=A0A5S5C4F6_9BACL|nr:beta-galactosidase [Paenibacillus methanolicus]TYP73362.1 beta-galactosidase-like protein [Paenibacillus methanolicus]